MYFKNYDYDLKDEIQEYKQCGNDDIYKFLLYKSSTDSFDCDRCSYAKEVYQKLWGFDSTLTANFQNICVGSQKILMGMDTMNSFWTTFAWCLNSWCSDDLQLIFGIENVTMKSIDILLSNYDALKRMIIKNLSEEVFNKLQTFAKLTHTIGNFLLVPKYLKPYTQGGNTFNQARALQCKDYIDLSLKWILENDEPVWDINTVNSYIDMFILQDYFTKNNQIIPFTDTHKKIIFDNANIECRPKNKEELLLLLNNTNNKIVSRGKKMYLLLMDVNPSVGQPHENIVQNTAPVKIRKETVFFTKSCVLFSIAYFILGLIVNPLISAIGLRFNLFILYILHFIFNMFFPIILAVFSANRRRIRYIEAYNKGTNKEIKILTITWKGVLVLLFLPMILGPTIGGMVAEQFSNFRVVQDLCAAAGIGAFVIGPVLVWGILRRCKNCKMLFMLNKTKTEESSREKISVKVEVKVKDKYGTVTGTKEQWVPGKKIWYKKIYKCKACGQVHYSLFSKDYANI